MLTKSKNPKRILSKISNGFNLTIEALDGQELLSQAENFTCVNFKFNHFDLPDCQLQTARVIIDIYEMVNDSCFFSMFASFGNPDKIILTQSQIINFCNKYPEWLNEYGRSTAFLTKADGEYFVIAVRVTSSGLDVYNHVLGKAFNPYPCRLVIQQVALLE